MIDLPLLKTINLSPYAFQGADNKNTTSEPYNYNNSLTMTSISSLITPNHSDLTSLTSMRGGTTACFQNMRKISLQSKCNRV